jgi:hypothetical protein
MTEPAQRAATVLRAVSRRTEFYLEWDLPGYNGGCLQYDFVHRQWWLEGESEAVHISRETARVILTGLLIARGKANAV